MKVIIIFQHFSSIFQISCRLQMDSEFDLRWIHEAIFKFSVNCIDWDK